MIWVKFRMLQMKKVLFIYEFEYVSQKVLGDKRCIFHVLYDYVKLHPYNKKGQTLTNFRMYLVALKKSLKTMCFLQNT